MPDNYIATFEMEDYRKITSQLLNYRLDPFIRAKEKEEGSNTGLIFPFARGLRFSCLLIYAIRETLSGSDLEVNWGQIIDDSEIVLSGECDIIIHKKGHIKKWNGNDNGNHVMDFRFIKKEHAVVVISCKSYLTKSEIEVEYCTNMLKYVKSVWLFAECCGPESVDLISDESKKIGYENFWYLYTWSRTTGAKVEDGKGWLSFIEAIKSLATITK